MRNLIIIAIAFCFFNQTVLRTVEDVEGLKFGEQYVVEPAGFDMDLLVTSEDIVEVTDKFNAASKEIFDAVDAKFATPTEDDKEDKEKSNNGKNEVKKQSIVQKDYSSGWYVLGSLLLIALVLIFRKKKKR